MTTYTAIADADIDPESPGTTTLFTRLRDNPISIAEADSTAPAPPSVTGFTGSRLNYIDDDGDWQANPFDIDTNIGLAWESIGPTGSGATNIWTALNNLPAETKWVMVKIIPTMTAAAAAGGNQNVYLRRNGSSAAIANNTRSVALSWVYSTSAPSGYTVVYAKVPVTSRKLDAYYIAITTTGSPTFTADMWLVDAGK